MQSKRRAADLLEKVDQRIPEARMVPFSSDADRYIQQVCSGGKWLGTVFPAEFCGGFGCRAGSKDLPPPDVCERVG